MPTETDHKTGALGVQFEQKDKEQIEINMENEVGGTSPV